MTKFNRSYVRTYIQTKLFRKSRRQGGSQIAEVPPALFLLFFAFLFPFINMFYLIAAYGAGWYLNEIELRYISQSRPADIGHGLGNPPTGTVCYLGQGSIPPSASWNNLFGVVEDIQSPVVAQYPQTSPPWPKPPDPNKVGSTWLSTIVHVPPLVRMQNIPFLPLGNIPGLGQDLTFTYNKQIQQEEPGP